MSKRKSLVGRLLLNLKNRRKTWNFEFKSKVCFSC